MPRILSGINPSSTKGLHLGNFFGAVKSHLEFQKKGECFYFVANIHSLNTIYTKKEVAENTQNVFAEYLSFGIDTNITTFFVESDVHAIPYLQTILNNAVTVAELQRMHGYKDKLNKETDVRSINAGLFSYPVLMAADILIFESNIVPVGEDQAQHVEICREIAKTFNNRYGPVLTIPQLFIKKETARVKGIDGVRKMSKSLGNDIPIFAPEHTIKKQIMAITTDPARIHLSDPGDPTKNVCFEYLELLDYDQNKLSEMKERYSKGKIGDVEIKNILFETFMDYFQPYRQKKNELAKHPDFLLETRRRGAAKANLIANKTLQKVLQAVGLV